MTDHADIAALCAEAIDADDAESVQTCLWLLRGRSSHLPPPEALDAADKLEARWKAKQAPAETKGEHCPYAAWCMQCLGLCRYARDPYHSTEPPGDDRPTVEMAVWWEAGA